MELKNMITQNIMKMKNKMKNVMMRRRNKKQKLKVMLIKMHFVRLRMKKRKKLKNGEIVLAAKRKILLLPNWNVDIYCVLYVSKLPVIKMEIQGVPLVQS